MGNKQANPSPLLTEEQRRTLTSEQKKWLDSDKPDWDLESARRVTGRLSRRAIGGPMIDLRRIGETSLAKEVAAVVVKALRQPRRKRALNSETKTARARRLAEELHPNGVGAVGKKNQKAIRSEFCDAYRERYGQELSDSQAWKALFGQRG
jgi:hypothetical protein